MKTNQRSSRRSVLTISTLLTLALVIVLSSAQNAVAQQQSLTRTLPLTVNNEVDIGSFAFTNGGGSLWISVTVPSSGYSVAKEYLLPIQYNQNINIWQTVLPASNTGAYSGNDFALDLKINGGSATLRLRTTASDGVNVGTAYVSIRQEGVSGDTFTASTSTSAVSAPTTFFTSTALTQVGGNVGIGTTAPANPLDISSNQNAVVKLIGVNNPSNGASAQAAISFYEGVSLEKAKVAVNGSGASGYVGGANALQLWNFLNAPIVFGTNFAERMRIDGSGNVGIGTTSPGYKLDVQGGPLNSSGGLCIAGDCKTAWSQVGGSQWTTSGSNIYYNSGNVGIGTATPDVNAKLHVYNAAGAGTDIQSANAAGWARLRLVTGTHSYGWFAGDSTQPDAPNKIGLYDYTAGAFRMMIDSLGNVGIGTPTPNKSSVSKALTVNGSTDAIYELAIGDVRKGTMYHDSTNLSFTNNASGALTLGTNNSERLRIDASGKVGIGTTSPGEILHVRKDQNAATHVLVENATAGNSAYPDFQAKNDLGHFAQFGLYSSTTSTAGALASGNAFAYTSSPAMVVMANNASGVIKFATGGLSERMRIDASGNVGIGISTPSTKLHVVGDGTITGNLTVTGNIAAKYQDVAEWVESSQELSAGTVVVLDQTKSNQVIASAQAYDTRVAGVISLQPGIALGEGGAGKVLVATTGRVRIKVDASRGAIQVGDLLVTSDVPGVAMKSQPIDVGGAQIHRPGTLIGKALEPLDKGTGEILVLLSLQ